MIVTEELENGMIKTYSNTGHKIRGGSPEGMYDCAIDAKSDNRTYTETDVPADAAEVEEATVEDYKVALAEFGVTE